jgi:protease-4
MVVGSLLRALRGLRNVIVGFFPVPELVSMEVGGRLPERRQATRGWRGLMSRRLASQQVSLEAWREQLASVAADSRIKGIVLLIGDLQADLGALERLRDALGAFRRSGKRLFAYLPTTTLRTYYLASVAEAIVVPESGELALHGLRAEATFLRTALDRLGILPQFHHIGEYKAAANRYLHSAMPVPEREMRDSLLDQTFAEIVAGIAQSRQLPEESVRQAIDAGILSAQDARERRLIDTIAYEDQLARLCGTGDQPASIRPWTQVKRRLHRSSPRRSSQRQTIGVIQILGAIVLGESREFPVPLPVFGRQLAGHQTIARAFRLAEQMPRLGAIVLHVDSPGGSAIASDLIWREVVRAQEKKPVIVHMGNVAGSGGYYVACGARHIVAGATTLTGSIGVVAGKFNARDLSVKVGIQREIMTRGATAAMPSPFTDYTETEWALLRGWMEEIYQRFKARVAAGRKKSMEEVEAVARGRVWTGRQALERGLIDEIGDFEAAVRRAKALMGLPAEADVPVRTLQPPATVPLPTAPAGMWEATLHALIQLTTEHGLALMPPDTLL